MPTANPQGSSQNHPRDNIRANGTSQEWTRPGMPPGSGGILRGFSLLGGVICPNVVSRVEKRADRIGTGPPRARTQVIYVDLGYWAILS